MSTMRRLILTILATLLFCLPGQVLAMTGEEVYNRACGVCHNAGIANAPKLGDKDTWTSRLEAGMEQMYASAINGKGTMPPKGGQAGLSDDEVKAAVDYMIEKSK